MKKTPTSFCVSVLTVGSFLLLTGCASLIEGRAQELTITTSPAGALCSVTRNGTPLGNVVTPGTLYLEKTKDDLTIDCRKPGYHDATTLDPSGYPKYNWAYILIGGPVGWGIDSTTGADNQYASPVHIDLSSK